VDKENKELSVVAQSNRYGLAAVVLQSRAFPPAVLALATLFARLLFHGTLYWMDGPEEVHVILEKFYVIQPPGYWLFIRTAGLFPDPTLAISAMNIVFSVAGVLMFYCAALLFTERRNAFLAALAYSMVFYVWFSGEVHSTQASQIFFPVATFYALLRYDRDKSERWFWLALILFPVGAGMRPSDGAFLFPMVAYFCILRLPRARAAFFLGAAIVLCLGWLIPTILAYQSTTGGLAFRDAGDHAVGVLSYIHLITTSKSIVAGVNASSMATVLRYVLPLVAAFWAVLPAAILALARNRKDWRFQMLLLWIVPGSLFFVFIYIADAPYLNYLTAAVLLLAVAAPRGMAITAVWNALIFLCFVPIPSRSLAINSWNVYVGKFTRYGIQHQWWPNLSEVQAAVQANGPAAATSRPTVK
jgi:4-amino-4-deoxy-L-arabinose transferase-like glycosyltransferase